MELTFDIRGNLHPYQKTKLSLNQFETFFVKSFREDSSRIELFANYLRFLDDFKKDITTDFIQWIDGSFISNKLNPNDIDFVTLIEHSVYQKKRTLIDYKFRLLKGKEFYGVDAYTVELFPKNDKNILICKSDLIYWDNWFSQTKKNWTKKQFPKGYIEIEFSTLKKKNN